MIPYSLVEVYRSLGGTCYLHPQGGSVGCVSPSRLSLNLCWTIQLASQKMVVSEFADYVNESHWRLHAHLFLSHSAQSQASSCWNAYLSCNYVTRRSFLSARVNHFVLRSALHDASLSTVAVFKCFSSSFAPVSVEQKENRWLRCK